MNNLISNMKLYEYETISFKLEVSLWENTIKITLRDFVDWTIYSKEYISAQFYKIHTKISIEDIYGIF